MPFFIGRSTSVSMISISCASAFRTSITCLGEFTGVTVEHKDPDFIDNLAKHVMNCTKFSICKKNYILQLELNVSNDITIIEAIQVSQVKC